MLSRTRLQVESLEDRIPLSDITFDAPPAFNGLNVATAQLSLDVEKRIRLLDGLSELGETESLRLQMAMDRLSKLETTLSNVLARISNIGEQITQHIK